MTQSEIAKTLEDAGFVRQPKKGIAMDAGAPTLRYARHGVRGSLYVSDNHLSATGAYADLRKRVPQSRSDHKGYPVWQGPALPAALEEFQARFHP